MKLRKGKEDQGKDFKLQEMMEKQLKEMEKNKVSPIPCPYINECTFKMLPNDFNLLCNDQEMGMETKMVHLKGRHNWELCKEWFEMNRQKNGKLPKELLAELKKKANIV